MEIKNIIFDLGGVLLSNHSLDFFKENLTYKEDAEKINNAWLNSKERKMLDEGRTTFNEILPKIIDNLPLRSKEEGIILYYKYWNNRKIMDGMLELIDELKKNGYSLFVLSNFQDGFNTFKEENKLSFLDDFKGIYISSEHKISKPDKEIYNDFLKYYSLKKEECIFIDDKIENVQSAEKVGIQSVHFINTPDLITKLKESNII